MHAEPANAAAGRDPAAGWSASLRGGADAASAHVAPGGSPVSFKKQVQRFTFPNGRPAGQRGHASSSPAQRGRAQKPGKHTQLAVRRGDAQPKSPAPDSPYASLDRLVLRTVQHCALCGCFFPHAQSAAKRRAHIEGCARAKHMVPAEAVRRVQDALDALLSAERERSEAQDAERTVLQTLLHGGAPALPHMHAALRLRANAANLQRAAAGHGQARWECVQLLDQHCVQGSPGRRPGRVVARSTTGGTPAPRLYDAAGAVAPEASETSGAPEAREALGAPLLAVAQALDAAAPYRVRLPRRRKRHPSAHSARVETSDDEEREVPSVPPTRRRWRMLVETSDDEEVPAQRR